MVRMICYGAVLLTAGVAQSAAPTLPDRVPQKQQIRFLSLAEARALALEQEKLLNPGLDSEIRGLQSWPPPAAGLVAVLAQRKSGRCDILLVTHEPSLELERGASLMLHDLELTYNWLYGSYWQLHSREQGLRLAYETWKIVGARYRDGKASRADFAKAEGQYDLFRSQRLQALDTVQQNELQLKVLLGMTLGKEPRLVPSDAPTLVEKKPDWDKTLPEALKNRPELRMAREDLRRAKWNLLMTEAIMLPILRTLGLEGDLVAPMRVESPNLCCCPELQNIPASPPCVHAAKVRLARAHVTLVDQELRTERYLGIFYRRTSSAYTRIKAAQAQREAFAAQMRVRSEKFRADDKDASLDLLLESQRFWADSLATEYQAIVYYNNALVSWEYAKGDIINYAHVALAEEPPAGCEKVRAVVFERRRTRELVRREIGAPPHCLPGLWKSVPPLQDAEELPHVEHNSPRNSEGADVRLIEWKVSDIFRHDRRHAKQTP